LLSRQRTQKRQRAQKTSLAAEGATITATNCVCDVFGSRESQRLCKLQNQQFTTKTSKVYAIVYKIFSFGKTTQPARQSGYIRWLRAGKLVQNF